jgi:hypothetical protein
MFGSVWWKEEVHTGFWWVYLRKRENLDDLGINLEKYLNESSSNVMEGRGLD